METTNMNSRLSTVTLDLDRINDFRKSQTSLLSATSDDASGQIHEKMPLEGSYAIWNNRGGSGKTNLTYHLAIKYAYRHPDKTVLVVDMCPQADLSHAFLGDDEEGHDYVSQIGSLKKNPMILDGQQFIPRTISGYLDLYTSVGLPNNVDPRTFLFNVSKFNNQLPRNVYLLCGDTSLELLGKAMDLKRSSNTITPYTNAWRTITQSLRVFIHKIGERRGIKLMTFIDTNSSFNISTEIALTAADKIILPVSEDHLHRNGFEYLFSLLYGFSQPSSIYSYYRHYSFYYRADENGVKLPKIHLILCTASSINKETKLGINNNSLPKPEEINNCWHFVYDIYTKHRDAFEIHSNQKLSPRLSSSSTSSNDQHFTSSFNNHTNNLTQVETFEEFMSQYVMHINNESNIVSRIAVKSHSPLLAVKHPHHSHEYQSTAQTFDKTLNDIVERI
ncbi:unnamed protein product [Rotaria sordida]|uniref:CobQ/CobB/MinD/ParA nucleotide binding domain-containing protein n=1 Tax=Rotaria sordida TaxID=392033 RepID=A0A815AB00_9BILA|nr:unnamed protein product [Rotaria sordida]CAF1288911.1 unnamed protein product [Rotaria sordida]CAF3696213.1 unnamed protein product [Rotaria sordida]CAF3731270.1 unnamed protein product [Rotaria sordida]